jgi:hypothetical protein
MTMALSLNQRRYVETVLAGLPHLAEAVAAIPPDWQPEAFQAAERSYLRAFRQLGLSGPQTWTSSVMRRLGRRVREVEKEKLIKLYEQLSVNEHGITPPIGQAHSFDGDLATSSEERKSVEEELSPDEQIDQTHTFATDEVGEFSADEQIGQGHNFAIDEAASEQNVVREPPPDKQIGQAHNFASDEAASSEMRDVVSEASPEEKSVARESIKKDRPALRMAKIMIKVEDVFDD